MQVLPVNLNFDSCSVAFLLTLDNENMVGKKKDFELWGLLLKDALDDGINSAISMETG